MEIINFNLLCSSRNHRNIHSFYPSNQINIALKLCKWIGFHFAGLLLLHSYSDILILVFDRKEGSKEKMSQRRLLLLKSTSQKQRDWRNDMELWTWGSHKNGHSIDFGLKVLHIPLFDSYSYSVEQSYSCLFSSPPP